MTIDFYKLRLASSDQGFTMEEIGPTPITILLWSNQLEEGKRGLPKSIL